MKTPFIIFLKGLGLYTAVTIPAIGAWPMYFLSLFYAVVYGWFACAVFIMIWLVVKRLPLAHHYRMLLLVIAVPVSVAFAFQMIEVCGGWDDVWHSGELMLFPAAAVIAGWISLGISEESIRRVCLKNNSDDNIHATDVL